MLFSSFPNFGNVEELYGKSLTQISHQENPFCRFPIFDTGYEFYFTRRPVKG